MSSVHMPCTVILLKRSSHLAISVTWLHPVQICQPLLVNVPAYMLTGVDHPPDVFVNRKGPIHCSRCIKADQVYAIVFCFCS